MGKVNKIKEMLRTEAERYFLEVEYIKRKLRLEHPQFVSDVGSFKNQMVGKYIPGIETWAEEFDKILLEFYKRERNESPLGQFDLSSLSDEGVELISTCHKLSLEYGFHAHRLVDLVDFTIVLKMLKKAEVNPTYTEYVNEGSSQISLPYKYPNYESPAFTFFCQTSGVHNDTEKIGQQLLNEQGADLAVLVKLESLGEGFQSTVDRIVKLMVSLYLTRVQSDRMEDLPEEMLSSFVGILRRKERQSIYKPSHYEIRAIGLWLWDKIHLEEEKIAQEEAIKMFRNTSYAQNISKYKESGETRLNNAIRAAEASVRAGEFRVSGK